MIMLRRSVIRHALAASCAAMALLASGGLAAQVDCRELPPGLQARCEGVNELQAKCAGLGGSEREACERENRFVPVTEDCSKAPKAARAMCEAHNRAAEKAEACNGLRGTALTDCQRANGLNPPRLRQP
jgi:hypothetical protein